MNLLLIYLNSWEDKDRLEDGKPITMAWQNYPYEMLDQLHKENLISLTSKFTFKKALLITEAGIQKAQELKKSLGL